MGNAQRNYSFAGCGHPMEEPAKRRLEEYKESLRISARAQVVFRHGLVPRERTREEAANREAEERRREEVWERARKEDDNLVITVLPSRKKLPSLFGNLHNPEAELRRREEKQRARREAEKLEREAKLRRREEEEERARKEAENQRAELRRRIKEEERARKKAAIQLTSWQRRHAAKEEKARKEAENQMAEQRIQETLCSIQVGETLYLFSEMPLKPGVQKCTEKERQLGELGELKAPKTNMRNLFHMQDTSVEQRKSVGRMDDGFIKTLSPVISQQQNNFEPIQEINISDKDSGTGVKAQRWQWEGIESNSWKTDARNIFDTTAAQGMEEVFPTSSTFSLKNRGQKQGNGEDNVKKQTLVLLTTGTVSRSPMGHETGRVDIYAGDKNLLSAGFRKEHGIRDIIDMHQTLVPSDAANDPYLKFLVRMRPYGEGKDSWEHCTTQDGDVGLPEEQPLYISQILRGSSTFPASATWVLETPDKCTPSSTLEAVLEIKLVTGDSMVPSQGSNVTSGNPVAQLSIQVQGKELQDAVTDLERPDSQQCGTALEEKYQTELMEK